MIKHTPIIAQNTHKALIEKRFAVLSCDNIVSHFDVFFLKVGIVFIYGHI
jgi:hypothetical protein